MESPDPVSSDNAKHLAADTVDVNPQLLSPSDNSEAPGTGPDVFERHDSVGSGGAGDGQSEEGFVLSRSLQDPSEELPIELISLTDR